MIRGPVLPQAREALWALVAGRLGQIERGLSLVLEGFDCAGGQFGLIEGLARDAAGVPVLVMLAVDGDPLLVPRLLSAVDFLGRVAGGLADAVPEAQFAHGAAGRLLVVGTDASQAALAQLQRLPVEGITLCRLEPFRIAGSERFAVRYLADSSSAQEDQAGVPSFAVSDEVEAVWRQCRDSCLRIDAGVRIDGDRHWRRISWRGRPLGEVQQVDGGLRAAAEGFDRVLFGPADVRAFVDHLLRTQIALAGLVRTDDGPVLGGGEGATRSAPSPRSMARRGGESLRATVAAAALSTEEYSALGGPASAAGGETGGAATADDVARIVAAQESPWLPPRRPSD